MQRHIEKHVLLSSKGDGLSGPLEADGDLKIMGMTWKHLERQAQDRDAWRSLTLAANAPRESKQFALS
jgi:hypothetical protein